MRPPDSSSSGVVGRMGRRWEIVPVGVDDLDALMEIERRASRSPWSRQIFVEELEREWAYVDFVRERAGGRMCAFINYWLVNDEVHILNIATHPDERRAGHASRLLEHVVAFAHRHRCRWVTLEVRRTNQPAIRLYKKYGFRPVGIRPNYYVEDREDAIVMVLELRP
jgi:ribosomal-protein-alanine N-acetyltransferase